MIIFNKINDLLIIICAWFPVNSLEYLTGQSKMKRTNINTENVRSWIVRWMYAVVIGHLLAGILLPWISGFPLMETYHRSIESVFWDHGAPLAARAQQVWWISLFGPTVQAVAIWMGVLVRIGDRQRSAFVWGWLMIGVIVWAPQDIFLSLRVDGWINVGIDCFSLLILLPPLAWLWRHDRGMPQAHTETASL